MKHFKTFSKFLPLLFMALLFTNCEEDELEPDETLTVSASSTEITSEAGTLTVTLYSNTNWEASSELSGGSFEPKAGGGSEDFQSITVSYPENPDEAARTFELVYSGPGIVKTITVSQAPLQPTSIVLDTEAVTINGAPQEFEIILNS